MGPPQKKKKPQKTAGWIWPMALLYQPLLWKIICLYFIYISLCVCACLSIHLNLLRVLDMIQRLSKLGCVLKTRELDCNPSLIVARISLVAPRERSDLDLVNYVTYCLPSNLLSLEVNLIQLL